MKKVIIVSGVVAAIIALVIFNRITSKNKTTNSYTEVKKGVFEITVTNSGELLAENSLDILGPEIGQDNGQDHDGHGGRGFDMHAMFIKIQDLVAEGTMVNEGDYIAQLDRTNYENTLKDELETLKTNQEELDMKILDSAVVMTGLRDEIKNQSYVVEEAQINLDQSKYEPPAVIHQSENNLDKAQRALEQKIKGYDLRLKQSRAEITNLSQSLSRQTQLVSDLQEFLSKFTITAPSTGMVTYKNERNGTKRQTGSSVNPFDRVIATLPDLSSMISKTYINEIDISKVKPGLAVDITIDAFPEKKYKGSIISLANVGEQLPNSDAKMFEVQIKIEGSDPSLRPSMTTGNRIIIKTYDDVVYVSTECVHTGTDSIPFVYAKNKTKQIVVLGESNEKNIIIKEGLTPGNTVFLIPPQNTESFRLAGENLIPTIMEKYKKQNIP